LECCRGHCGIGLVMFNNWIFTMIMN